ncbi:hypothetical protein QUF76_15390 [Desulfobacterales bacterium HSG16]|nr:hypothetical protein [Desulfobacterales bacterium HSG16]
MKWNFEHERIFQISQAAAGGNCQPAQLVVPASCAETDVFVHHSSVSHEERQETEERFAESARAFHRLSKFQQALPVDCSAEIVGKYLLDMEGGDRFFGKYQLKESEMSITYQ